MIIDNIKLYIPILSNDSAAIAISLIIDDVILIFIASVLLPNACSAFERGYSI